MTTALIEVETLVKEYGIPSARIPVLRGITLSLGEGERVALLGKSGSGKSTLLNLLGGLDVPTSGTIRFSGRDLGTMAPNERARFRLNSVGMIFQAFHLIPTRSALENVELPMILAGRPKIERRAEARRALEAVGMGHRLDHRPNSLSGGERQRVAIARALVNQPPLVLADEPTGNLDTSTGEEVIRLILEYLSRQRATLVLVTHDEDLARRCADRIVRLQDGLLMD